MAGQRGKGNVILKIDTGSGTATWTPLENLMSGVSFNKSREVRIPKMTIQGLGDYSRTSGFVDGDVTLTWETHSLTQDRGRSFQIDNMDNMETIDTAFGQLAGEFIRTKVVAEIDAYRMAKLFFVY